MIFCKMLASCVGAILTLHGGSGYKGCVVPVLKYKFILKEKSHKVERIFVTYRRSPSRLGSLFKHCDAHCISYIAKALKKIHGYEFPGLSAGCFNWRIFITPT